MLQEEVNRAVTRYAKKLAVYMNANLNEAINKGYNGGQEASLRLTENIIDYKNGDFTIQIIASGDYWRFIEYGVNGRKQNQNSPFSFKKEYINIGAVGKDWQSKNKIDARKIIAEIRLKRSKSLRISKKSLNFDKATKQLASMFARSIARKGLKKRPFIDKAIQDSNLQRFLEEVAEIMKKNITLTLIKP